MIGARGTSVRSETHADVTVVTLVGDHDAATVKQVREQLDAVATSGAGLVVSLMETTFFDSSVVHALYDANGKLVEHDRQLVLHVATAPIVSRVLEVSGLRATVRTTGSLQEAIELARRTTQRVSNEE
jgi:anti-sigma B factor antagonist